jgi:hypothetical protein
VRLSYEVYLIVTHTYFFYTFFSYFIPEDGDSELQPNVFLAPKPRQQGTPPTLEQIKRAFPLSGRYHFRFKAPLVPGGDRDKSAMAVWMDCVDDRQYVPTWKSGIVAKVTRIGVDDDDDDDDEDFVRVAPSASPAPAAASYDLFEAPSAPQPATVPAPTTSTPPTNLLDGHSPDMNKESLLDMHTPYNNNTTPTSAATHDFFGTSAPPPPQQTPMASVSPPISGNYNSYGGQPAQQNFGQNMYGQQPQGNMYGGQQQQQQQQRPTGQPPRPGQSVFDQFSKAKNPGAFGDLHDFTM